MKKVDFPEQAVVVSVALRRRNFLCSQCDFQTWARYDTRPVESTWRHLDLGQWRLIVTAGLRRINCPTHGVVTEGVSFARAGSHHTADFENLVGFLATTMNKTNLARLLRIDWDSVGRIITRVMGDSLDPKRLDDLFVIGVDEVSWRKGHKYVTLVSNHQTGQVVWGKQGKDAETFNAFFDELGTKASKKIKAVSMDMSPAFEKSARKPGHATKAVICFDLFHVIHVATKALDQVRRTVWNEMRALDKDAAKRFKGARWCLMKNPDNLDDDQAATLAGLRRRGGDLWRAYALKEALRAIFAGDLDPDEVAPLLDRFCSRAQRSRLKPFETLAKTIRKRREGILAAVHLGISNECVSYCASL